MLTACTTERMVVTKQRQRPYTSADGGRTAVCGSFHATRAMPTMLRALTMPPRMTPRSESVAAAAKSEKPTNAGPGPICRLTATPAKRTATRMVLSSGAVTALSLLRPTIAHPAKATLAAAVTPTTRG